MVKFSFVAILLLFASCASQPQVHIFSLGVGDAQVAHLSSLLEDVGFNAQPNTLPVPPSVLRHTVIFPAIVPNFAIVELIESTLETAGYPRPRLVLETDANHYYSSDNIGVYLVDPDFEGTAADLLADPYALGGEDATPLSYNYFSECPKGSEAQSELNLYPSGMAILEEFVWDEKSQEEISVLHDGEWESDSAEVRLSLFRQGELRFSITEHTGSDWFGPFEALTLVSQSSTMDIERCNYTYKNHTDY